MMTMTLQKFGFDALTMEHPAAPDLVARLIAVPPSHRLFVYGTLMVGADGPYGQAARGRLAQEAPQRIAASTAGQLFELGQYPGLVLVNDSAANAPASDPATDIVHGQLLLLPDPLATWPWLDAYEGIAAATPDENEYVRILRNVTTASGAVLSAWTYVYRKPVLQQRRIAGGRWTP
jgi:gamma-glutamylcyclotransferase (GGCT)/AIG2-like uncharacterized protein YtfP